MSDPTWSFLVRHGALGTIDVLKKVQKRAVNMVNGLGDLTYEQKLHKLGLEPLADRRAYADSVLMYKTLPGISSVKKDTWVHLLERNEHLTRATAGLFQLRAPFARTDTRKNYYTVRICDMWNALPNDLRGAKSVRLFKFAYRSYMQRTRRGQGDQHRQ
jgi:hypothetical protein